VTTKLQFIIIIIIIKLILKKEGVRMWSESVQGPGSVADFGRR